MVLWKATPAEGEAAVAEEIEVVVEVTVELALEVEVFQSKWNQYYPQILIKIWLDPVNGLPKMTKKDKFNQRQKIAIFSEDRYFDQKFRSQERSS